MPQKKSIQLKRPTSAAAAKEAAAQLAGKKAPAADKRWTETFAASGAKVGGKPPPVIV